MADFSDIKLILEDYTEEVQEEIKKVVKDVSEEAKKKVSDASPVNVRKTKKRGSYKKGWRVNVEEGNNFINAKVYNKTDYQLTHLLENPHHKRNGAMWYPKKQHIAPVNDWAQEEVEKEIIKAIGGIK